MWCVEEGQEKCIISKDVTFDEMKRTMANTKEKQAAESQQEVPETLIEFEVWKPSSNETENHISADDTSQVETSKGESSQTENLQSYSQAKDRKRRQVKPPAKYEKAEIVYYAFCIELEDVDTPLAFKEAVNSRDSVKWQQAMQRGDGFINKKKLDLGTGW